MARDGLPEILNDIKPAFQEHFGTDFRGTLLNDLSALGAQEDVHQIPVWEASKTPTDLESGTYDELIKCINRRSLSHSFHSYLEVGSPSSLALEPVVQHHHRLTAQGVDFSTFRRSRGNAQVSYRSPQNSDTIVAGQIQDIFVHKRPGPNGDDLITEFFLVIRQYQELSSVEASFDPYRKYERLDVRLCHDKLSSTVVVISPHDIVSHFSSCEYETTDIDGKLRVVLSLDRVSYLFINSASIIMI